jgi:hypothetical protein
MCTGAFLPMTNRSLSHSSTIVSVVAVEKKYSMTKKIPITWIKGIGSILFLKNGLEKKLQKKL